MCPVHSMNEHTLTTLHSYIYLICLSIKYCKKSGKNNKKKFILYQKRENTQQFQYFNKKFSLNGNKPTISKN